MLQFETLMYKKETSLEELKFRTDLNIRGKKYGKEIFILVKTRAIM